MPADNLASRQYFLGVGGEQVGPYSEEQIREKIRTGEVPGDALVWYEGLSEWVPLDSVEFFRDAWGGGGNESPPSAPPPISNAPILTDLAGPPPASRGFSVKPLNNEPEPPSRSPRKGASALARSLRESAEGSGPVFGGADEPPWYTDRRMLNYAAIGGGAVFLIPLLYLVVSALFFGGDSEERIAGKLNSRDIAAEARDARLKRVQDAEAVMVFKPEEGVATLKSVVTEKSDDSAAVQALASLKRFYQRGQREVDYARFLREVKKFKEAAPIFAKDPNGKKEAIDVYFEAYNAETDPKIKRELLVSHIQALSTDAERRGMLPDKVRLLEKEFPGQKHAFGFYLKDTEKRITDLFTRLSPVLLQGLVAYIEAEFPEIHLLKRPVAELKKNKEGLYRITASYSGDVQLRTDTVRGVKFGFWYVDERWSLVETNFTPERRRQADAMRARINGRWTPPEQMVRYLEGIFVSQFPNAGLHEPISPSSRRPTRVDD